MLRKTGLGTRLSSAAKGSSPAAPKLRQRARVSISTEHGSVAGESKNDSSKRDGDSDRDEASSVSGRSRKSSLASMVSTGQMNSKLQGRRGSKGSCVSGVTSATSRTKDEHDHHDHDEPIPIDPWCRKCPSVRPFGILPLRPEEVNEENSEKRRAAELQRKFSGMGGFKAGGVGIENIDDDNDSNTKSTIELFAEHMKQTIAHPGLFTKKWPESVHDIKLCPSLAKSRFSNDPYQRDYAPPVMHRLTEAQVGLLEVWCVNHIKMQYVLVCARAHAWNYGVEGRKHRQAIKTATVCQLVRRMNKGKLKDEEYQFLIARLEQTPFLSDMPRTYLEKATKLLKVCSFVRGAEIFRPGDACDGVYILVQGEVEVRSEERGSLQMNRLLEATCAVLPEDLLRQDPGRLFLPKNPEDRVRSKTAIASLGKDSTPVVMMLYVPFSVIADVSQHFRKEEAKTRRHLVAGLFAQAAQISSKLCVRHGDIFEVKDFPKDYVLMQEGTKPLPNTAQLMLIVEGTVILVNPGRQHATATKWTARKDLQFYGGFKLKSNQHARRFVGRGHILGDSALYGEPYPASAIVASENVKVLVVRAIDYLEKLLHRSTVMQRPVKDDSKKEGQLAGADEDADVKYEVAPELPVVDWAVALKHTVHEVRRAGRLAIDKESLMNEHWQVLRPKSELPRARPPQGPPARADDGGGKTDLCYPTKSDMFPLVQRSVPSRRRSQSGFSPQCVSARIERSIAVTDRLEAEHRSHSVYGYHIEDAGGTPLPLGPVMSPVPGSSVLLSCGAIWSPSLAVLQSTETSQ